MCCPLQLQYSWKKTLSEGRNLIKLIDLKLLSTPKTKKNVHFQPQAEERFHDQPIHPAGRARVPGPATAAGVRRERIDIGGDDVGFDFVGRHPLPAFLHGLPG